jgi:hypothetical protein
MKPGRKIVLAIVSLGLMASLVVWLLTRRTSPPAVEFADAAAIRAAMTSSKWRIVLDRCLSFIPPLNNALKPRINIRASLMETKVSPHLIVSNLLTGLPETVTNSLRAWVLTSSQLARLSLELEQSNYMKTVSSPRIDTAEGIGATLGSGESRLVGDNRHYTGVEVSVCPWASQDTLQLVAHVVMTDSRLLGKTGTTVVSLATNFDVGLRTSFPDGGGVFVLDARNSNAVLISSRKQKAK